MENSVTIQNLESAFAGESMAFMKYTYFANICRELGDEDTAKVFEETAKQELKHAQGHADLLFPKKEMTVQQCLQYAIEGETYEYTEMYPTFKHKAMEERYSDAVREFDEQIAESKEHAQSFKETLDKASKRFAALAKVEERHANNYKLTLEKIS